MVCVAYYLSMWRALFGTEEPTDPESISSPKINLPSSEGSREHFEFLEPLGNSSLDFKLLMLLLLTKLPFLVSRRGPLTPA